MGLEFWLLLPLLQTFPLGPAGKRELAFHMQGNSAAGVEPATSKLGADGQGWGVGPEGRDQLRWGRKATRVWGWSEHLIESPYFSTVSSYDPVQPFAFQDLIFFTFKKGILKIIFPFVILKHL